MVLGNMLKQVHTFCSGIQRVPNDCHNKCGKHKGPHHIHISAPNQIVHTEDVFKNAQADGGDEDTSNQNAALQVRIQNVGRTSNRLFVHVAVSCRFLTKCDGGQSVHNHINPENLDNRERFSALQHFHRYSTLFGSFLTALQ